MLKNVLSGSLSALALCAMPLFAANWVEPNKTLPLAQDVDVVIVGGTCGAVAAAEAAAKAGAKVFLVTAYGSLGEDVAGTLRVWTSEAEVKSTELMGAMFSGTPAVKGVVYTTPLQVKKALDKALLQAGVTFLTGSYATDVLTDKDGYPAGVVMANRSGRQAVRAKVVIDATERAALARSAGVELTLFPAGEYVVSRVTIGDKAPDCGGKSIKHADWNPDVDEVFALSGKTKITPALFENTFKVKFVDGSARSFAEAENAARDKTFTELQLDAADRIFFVPPDSIKSRKPGVAWAGAAAFDLNALCPSKVPHLYVLGAMADVPRNVAEKLMEPASAIQIGARLGQQAAAEAKARGALTEVRLRGGDGAGVAADVREVQGTLTHAYVSGSGTVFCDARALPVLAETDLVVVGGGTTGGPAAVGAVRNGLKTLVVEQLYELGGVQTAGMICGY